MMKNWKWNKKQSAPIIKEVIKEVPTKPPEVMILNCSEDAEEHIAHLEEYILTLEKEIDILKNEVIDAKNKTSASYSGYDNRVQYRVTVPEMYAQWSSTEIPTDAPSATGTTIQPYLRVD